MRSLKFNFFDRSGNAISSPAIPATLALTAFNYASVDDSWLRESDGKQLLATGFISSLAPSATSPVPEPSTYALLAVGLLTLGAVAQ